MQNKSAVAKVLPWLWPVADEALGACFALEHKLGLLQALKGCQGGDEQEQDEKVQCGCGDGEKGVVSWERWEAGAPVGDGY